MGITPVKKRKTRAGIDRMPSKTTEWQFGYRILFEYAATLDCERPRCKLGANRSGLHRGECSHILMSFDDHLATPATVKRVRDSA